MQPPARCIECSFSFWMCSFVFGFPPRFSGNQTAPIAAFSRRKRSQKGRSNIIRSQIWVLSEKEAPTSPPVLQTIQHVLVSRDCIIPANPQSRDEMDNRVIVAKEVGMRNPAEKTTITRKISGNGLTRSNPLDLLQGHLPAESG